METTEEKLKGKRVNCRSYEEKFKAIMDVQSGMKKKLVAKKFGVPTSTLSTWLKNRETIEEANVLKTLSVQRKRRRLGRFEEIEEALLHWLRDVRRNNMSIRGPLILAKAREFSDSLGVRDFKCSIGWLNRFKNRYGIVIKGSKNPPVEEDVQAAWVESVLKSVIENYQPEDIYNAEESAILYKMLSDQSIHASSSHSTSPDNQITVLVACSMTGHRLPLLVIGSSETPQCLQEVNNFPTDYAHNKDALMTMRIFEDWVRQLNEKVKQEGRKICLMVASSTVHVQPKGLSNVRLIFLPPSILYESQPCNRGIIRCLKLHYRCKLMEGVLSVVDTGRRADTIEISVLDAMKILQDAWCSVSVETIRNCFVHCGFSPSLSSDTLSESLQSEVEAFMAIFWQLQEREIVPADSDPEDFLHIDDNMKTSSASPEADIVEYMKNEVSSEENVITSTTVQEEQSHNVEPEVIVPPPVTVSKDEALMCVDTLQSYFEQCNTLQSDRKSAVFDCISQLRHELGPQTKNSEPEKDFDSYFITTPVYP